MKIRLLLLLLNSTQLLLAQTERYAVVIHEIMADPTPMVGLPNTEYIELRNTSDQPINLFRWKIDNGSTTATININFMLQPDSLVLLCSRTQIPLFAQINNSIGLTSFPSINNEGDLLTLKSPDNKTIHAVEFNNSWYNSPLKSNGGWSLEMIDPNKACAKNNWSASINARGGTPGLQNSINKKLEKTEDPILLQCIALTPTSLLISFDAPLDSLSLANQTLYQLREIDAPTVSFAKPSPPLFNLVELHLNAPIDSNRIYTLQIADAQLCNQQKTKNYLIKTGLPKHPTKGDIVFNEILFDPEPGGTDFIEVVNTSNAIINLNKLVIGNRNTDGSLNMLTHAYLDNFNLFPFEYYVLSTDTNYLMKKWHKAQKDKLISMKSLPSMPDDDGNLLLLNNAGTIIDEVNYDKNMHYPLLRNKEGVALEKINYRISSKQRDNWHSAASSALYGTPTNINSQYSNLDERISWIEIKQTLIHPDNNGTNDFLQINYQFEIPGTLLSVYLFNPQGSKICTIINNLLCGTNGTFNWNGLDHQNNYIPTGIYITVAEAFHLNGQRKKYKKLIAIKRA